MISNLNIKILKIAEEILLITNFYSNTIFIINYKKVIYIIFKKIHI